MRLTKVREDDHYGMREVIQVVRMVVGIAMTVIMHVADRYAGRRIGLHARDLREREHG